MSLPAGNTPTTRLPPRGWSVKWSSATSTIPASSSGTTATKGAGTRPSTANLPSGIPSNATCCIPQQTIRGIDNSHYPQYNAVVSKSAGNNPFFPTEFLHALYDGGGGAGLHDYWKVMTASKVASGGFIWAFLDEDVVRTDKGGRIDSNGNQAPDGIVGPVPRKGRFVLCDQGNLVADYRLAFRQTAISFTVENHYSFIDAKQCSFTWEWRLFKSPTEPGAGYEVTLKGDAAVQGSVPPGTTGKLSLLAMPNMPNISETPRHDAAGPHGERSARPRALDVGLERGLDRSLSGLGDQRKSRQRLTGRRKPPIR